MRTDALWGGTLNEIAVDLEKHDAKLTVTVVEAGQESNHELWCRRFTDLRLFNGLPARWDYAELTEVHVSFDSASSTWLLEAILWSDEAGLAVRCAELIMDGEPILASA